MPGKINDYLRTASQLFTYHFNTCTQIVYRCHSNANLLII